MDRAAAQKSDWHIHTHLSDGRSSPEEVIRVAAEIGLTRIAITDHDCLDAHRGGTLDQFGQIHGLFVIPGVEIDCRVGDQEAEVLGYAFDPDHPPLVERLARLQGDRRTRFDFYCEGLARAGEPVEVGGVLSEHNRVPIKVHLYNHLLAAGRTYPGGYREFKAQLDGLGAAPAVDKPTLQESVDLIRAADGFVLLAHPLFYAERFGLENLLRSGRDAGCVGAELFYPYDFGEKGLPAPEVSAGYRELLRLLPTVWADGAEASRGTDVHDLDEWRDRLAAVARWEDEMLPEEKAPEPEPPSSPPLLPG